MKPVSIQWLNSMMPIINKGVAYDGIMVWAPSCTHSLRSYAACWWSVIQLNSRLNTMPNLQGTWNLNL